MINQNNIRKLIILLGLVAAFVFIWKLGQDKKNIKKDIEQQQKDYQNQEQSYQEWQDGYQKWQKEFPNQKKSLAQLSEERAVKPSSIIDVTKTNAQVTNNNFEGAQVKLHAVEHWGTAHQKETRQMLNMDSNHCLFDPDHPRMGMPDIEVHLTPVKLYQPGKNKLGKRLSNFFNLVSNDKPKPYKTIKKKIDTGNDTSKEIELQMWLMEFNLTLSAKPDILKNKDVRAIRREENGKTYPSHWYNRSEGTRLSVNDLNEENKNQRYGNLKLWLEINPNKSPFYINNGKGQSEKPEIAIGAVYCMELSKKPVDNMNRIASSVLPSKELSLYTQPLFRNKENGVQAMKDLDLEALIGTSRNDTTEQSIWNKPYYVKIFLKNFGTWEAGFFNQNKYHDQITYTFLMPLLVEGSLDVIGPTELLRDWAPPEPYHKKPFDFASNWKTGFGKIISRTLLFAIGLAVVILLFPNILTGFTKLLFRIFKNKNKP